MYIIALMNRNLTEIQQKLQIICLFAKYHLIYVHGYSAEWVAHTKLQIICISIKYYQYLTYVL